MAEQAEVSKPIPDKFEKSFYNRPMPKSFLQAAELEEEDFGKLRVNGKHLEYFDYATRVVFLSISYASPAEAGLQMKFYRQSYKDVLDRRMNFRVVN
jgi:hypothetical protein